jgi:hypothetical protein
MRKRIIDSPWQSASPPNAAWFDLEQLAMVEITSEDAAHPIESALRTGTQAGWQASQAGEQIIRIIFDEPQRLRRIWLLFIETMVERTQELLLRWSPDGGRSYHEIVRQQWNFNPQTANREAEDYRVALDNVTILELKIAPDINGGNARATLAQLRLA